MKIKNDGKLRVKTNDIKTGLITLFITVLAYILYWFIFPLSNSMDISNNIVFLFSWVGILIFSYIIFSWYRLTESIFSLYTIFILFFFLFNFGQSIMWAFGIHIQEEIGKNPIYPGFSVPSNADIVNGQMITCISILMFHLGAVICYKPRKFKGEEYLQKKSNIIDTKTLKAIFITSIIIGSIVFPVTLFDTYNSLKVALTSGYKALYYSEYAQNKSTIIILLKTLFFPSLVGLLIGSRYNKKIMIFVYLLFSVYLTLNLLAGDRGSWVYKIIILAWLSHVCYKPISFRKVIKYLIISFVGLYIVEAIVSLRNTGLSEITMKEFFNSFSFENSPLVSTIFDMGGSMSVVMILIMNGWDVWPYANTYLLGLMGMVTNQVIYVFDLPFSLISSWFSQDYLGIPWGAGFSIIAEAVLNIGPHLAPLIMLIFGYIISSMIYIDKNIKYMERPLLFLFAVTTLHAYLPVTRNFIHLILKEWFYGVVLFIILILLVKNLILKQTKTIIQENLND